MHRNVIFTFGLIVYFIVTTVGLYAFEAGIVTSAIILLGLPAYLLARFSAAPTAMLITVTCFATGIALLLEGVAHAYGLWHVADGTGFMLWNGVSFEILIVALLKILFLVLFYELLFDDGNYSTSRARNRFEEFGLFAVGAVAVIAAYAFFFKNLSAPSAYYWITIALMTASFAMLLVHRALTQTFVTKIATYVAVAAIPLLCVEVLAVANGFKVIDTLLHPISLSFFNISLPFAEILLALSIPTFVTAMYEVYLDDQL